MDFKIISFKKIKTIILLIMLEGIWSCTFGQSSNYLLRIQDKAKDNYGYVNLNGDTLIPLGKYLMCYTDTFSNFAIVLAKNEGIIAINRKEEKLYNVFPFDNGPDYPSDGLFRIIKGGKIGFANLKGVIVIQPQYDCAYPFKNGKAMVGKGCKTIIEGEHLRWINGKWFTIDKKGGIIK